MQDRSELVAALKDAQDTMLEGLEALKQVQRATGDEWARRYIIAHLETTITNDNEWLGNDESIDDWISNLINCELCGEGPGVDRPNGDFTCDACEADYETAAVILEKGS